MRDKIQEIVVKAVAETIDLTDAIDQLLVLYNVSKRYKIQGTSFTTNGRKWFEFDEKGWQEFKKKRWTHYPAWHFDDNSITEFNVC